MKNIIKLRKNEGIKGFNADLKCIGFQYEIGKSYRHKGKISLCSSGFHFARSLAAAKTWYPGNEDRFCIVKHGKNTIHEKDKSVTTYLKIVREISKAEIIEQMQFIELQKIEAEKQKNKFLKSQKGIINEVFRQLKEREINPTGTFDRAGRWYAHNSEFISARPPSRAYPYSEMGACRTKKYVTKICFSKNITTLIELLKAV